MLAASRGASVTATEVSGMPMSAAELYREHRAFLWRALRHLGVPESDLDDAIQEVFVVVHRKLDTFDGSSSPRTWLFGIARMTAMGMRRKAVRRREDLVETLPEMRTDPTDQVEHGERLELARRTIAEMPEDQRLVFVLFEIEEMPMADVARALDCPLKTAYGRLYRARDTFRAALESAEGPHGQ